MLSSALYTSTVWPALCESAAAILPMTAIISSSLSAIEPPCVVCSSLLFFALVRRSSRAFSSTPDGKGQNLSLIFQSSYTLLLMRLNPEHRVIDACLLGVPPESPDTKMLTHRVFHLKLVGRHVVQKRKETFGIFTIHINPIIIILDLYSFIVIYCDYGKE